MNTFIYTKQSQKKNMFCFKKYCTLVTNIWKFSEISPWFQSKLKMVRHRHLKNKMKIVDKHFIFSTENISQCLYVSKTVIMKFHFHHYYTLFLCQSVQRSSNHFLQSLSFLSWMLSYVFKDVCFIYGQINVKKQKVSDTKIWTLVIILWNLNRKTNSNEKKRWAF